MTRDAVSVVTLDGLLYERNAHVSFATASRYAQQLLRPNAVLRARVAAQRAALGLAPGAPFVALHVRRGDSAWEKGEWLPLAEMLTAARRAARALALPRPATLFLASDTADAVRYITAAAGRWRFNVRVAQNQSRYELSDVKAATLNELNPLTFTAADKDAHSLQFITDLMIMRDAAAFVGTLNSNIGRLMAELRNGTNCHFVDAERHKFRLHLSTTRLDNDDGSPQVVAPDDVPSINSPPAPLAAFWPSFYGLWPSPDHHDQPPDVPRNPLWWWRSRLYGRGKRFAAANEQLVARERNDLRKMLAHEANEADIERNVEREVQADAERERKEEQNIFD